MTRADIAGLDAVEIARRVRARELSAREVAAAALDRIAGTEPEANAFIHVDHDGALAQAGAVDRALAAGRDPGALAGVPVSVKDLVHVHGMPTSFGSAVFAGTMAPGDAAPIARLRAAGAVIVGKTTTPEFGHKPMTDGPLFGRTLNPWNRRYTCGGSSGGAAVSVALSQVPLAVGTDGGGSIRIPASVCGVYGLKPTLGRVPHVHAADLFANNSYIGPMARTAADLRAMYRAMSGPDPRDPWSLSLPADGPPRPERLRVGHALTVGNPVVEPEVAAAFERALAALADLGAELIPLSIDLHRFEPGFRAGLESMLASRFGARLESERARWDPSFAVTLANGLARTGVEVQAASAARTTMFHLVEAALRTVDVIVTPTVAAASIPADADPHADIVIAGRNCGRIRAGWYPYTFPLNLTGHPALSMPCGRTSENLPIGLQLAGPWYAEERLIDLAEAVTGALGISHSQPIPARH